MRVRLKTMIVSRSRIITLFPEQLLIDFVSFGSLGVYSKINCFLGDAFGVLPCLFWSTDMQCGARLQIQTFELLNCVVSGARL